jgi:hypothetical protein
MAEAVSGHKELTRCVIHVLQHRMSTAANLDKHISQEDFKAALGTKGKYVLIYAYQGEINPNADE